MTALDLKHVRLMCLSSLSLRNSGGLLLVREQETLIFSVLQIPTDPCLHVSIMSGSYLHMKKKVAVDQSTFMRKYSFHKQMVTKTLTWTVNPPPPPPRSPPGFLTHIFMFLVDWCEDEQKPFRNLSFITSSLPIQQKNIQVKRRRHRYTLRHT